MGNYASAYEEYYKNINNRSRDNEQRKNSFFRNNKTNNDFMMHSDNKIRYFTKSYWIKRLERELAGSLVLLSCVAGLKYSNNQEMNKFYVLSKQTIMSQFDYDQSIEAFNSIEIGNFKVRDVRIGQFKVEDLKYENLKKSIENFKEYLNQTKEKSMEI